jgi:hypothetical protein
MLLSVSKWRKPARLLLDRACRLVQARGWNSCDDGMRECFGVNILYLKALSSNYSLAVAVQSGFADSYPQGEILA